MMSEKLASELLDIEAVSIVDTDHLFTWVSGIKSPVYCDNRLTISYPSVRTMIADGFTEIIKTYFPKTEVIAGTATAGIPHAAWVSDRLELPMIYVRSSAKEHGKGNQIEGILKKGAKVVLIEDLLSTGGSALNACEAIENAGGEVIAILAIFSYNFKSLEDRLNQYSKPYKTLTDFKTLLNVAVDKKLISENQIERLNKWSDDPKIFSR